ncbi:HIRAN domain-containing protein [uncultured Methanobrevibacter sp.]|uniref:HIRAN domain-containing protein n=1 Tax=uncultured Methanobrevibacter sp. TaxID=253161 RepID=UPI0025E3E028|nr:HIRAN domain-containing protein [uncultured Methanobrevibacter sp.]
MYFVYQAKVVGLQFHKVENVVEQGDYVILKADESNEFDSDAIAVYNGERELIGYIANSEKTLSPNNIKNGNISATELKGNIDFSNREYYAEAIRVYNSCIYLEVNEGKWSNIQSVKEEISEIEALQNEVNELKAIVCELQSQVADLTNAFDIKEDSPNDRVKYSVVGLSHFDGQNHLGYDDLSIVEEPIFENAKGTALYLKSGDYRVGVFPSVKKKEYCEEHGIPYVDGSSLKGKVFKGKVIIEQIVYNEYAVISI